MMIIESRTLLRKEIRLKIARMILDSNMQQGDRLPSEKKLGEMFGVNHLTIRAALSELAVAGIVERVSSVGTFYIGGAEAKNEGFKTDNLTHSATFPNLSVLFLHGEKHFFNDLSLALERVLQKNQLLNSQFRLIPKDLDNEAATIHYLKQAFSHKPGVFLAYQPAINKSAAISEVFNQHAQTTPKVIRLLGNDCVNREFIGHWITVDYHQAMREAIAALYKLGHRRIAYITGDYSDRHLNCWSNRRHASIYAEVMLELNLADKVTIFSTKQEEQINQHLLDYFSYPAQKRVTAFICVHDNIIIRLLDMAKNAGLSIPDHISLIGFGDTPWSRHFNFATFGYPIEAICQQVDQLIQQNEVKSGLTIFPVTFMPKNTLGEAKSW